jgi:hypothetical protein
MPCCGVSKQIEWNMHLHYLYVQSADTSAGRTIDYFAARMDSIGLRAYLYYLGSPYREPFGASGAPTESTCALVERIKRDVDWLLNEMPDGHALAPNTFLGYEGQRRLGHARTQYASVDPFTASRLTWCGCRFALDVPKRNTCAPICAQEPNRDNGGLSVAASDVMDFRFFGGLPSS